MNLPQLNTIDTWLRQGVSLKETTGIKETEFIDDLFDQHFQHTKFQKLYLYKEALECIIGNLVYVGNINKPLSKPCVEYYKVNWLRKTILKNVFNILVENDYAINYNGYYNIKNPKWSRSAKYYPTQKLIDLKLNIKQYRYKELIRIFNVEGKHITYRKTAMIKKWIKNLEDINKIICNSTIKYQYKDDSSGYNELLQNLINANHIKEIDNEYQIEIDSSYVYRSFARNSFTFGGRFYTAVFQSIPSKWRNTITIDNEETIELDYSAHHIRMLYNMKGLNFNGEAYIYRKDDIYNKDKRQIHKYIAMIAINAKNENNALFAVLKSIKDDKESGKYNSSIPSIEEIRSLYYDFINHHQDIREYVSNDVGIKLQRKDSDIMNDILVELSKLNIVGLPVHDSVIVKKKHQDILKYIMINSYFKFMKFNPIIS